MGKAVLVTGGWLCRRQAPLDWRPSNFVNTNIIGTFSMLEVRD
jgi:hypothetical protein